MAWASTREAPLRAWVWSDEDASAPTPPDEEAAVRRVDELVGLSGRSVLDLGCGRGACLRLAAALGAGPLFGVDPSRRALEVTRLAVPEARLVEASGDQVPLPDGVAEIVWSHGVVEHLGDGLEAYLREAIRLSSRFVAFSAPNPRCPAYSAFRHVALETETWEWGLEEPLPSYAPALRRLRCRIVWAGDVGRTWREVGVYGDRLQGEAVPVWRHLCAIGAFPGVATLVVGKISPRP